MDLWRAFELLEIDKNSSPAEIKQRYRHLAGIWHPDRHANNPPRQQIAQEKMKEVNAAYDCICAYLLLRKNAGIEAEAAHTYWSKVIVTCPHCGMTNRVGAYDQADAIRCGKCGKYLFGYADESQEDEWEKRTLCGDENCIGVIGPNGRCNYCGRSFEEARVESKHRETLKEEELQKAAEKRGGKQKIKFSLYIAFAACLIVFVGLIISNSLDNVPEQHDKAMSDYSKGIEIHSRLPSAYLRGVGYYRKGQYDKAISDFSRVLEINPRLAGAYSSRGIAYSKKGQYDKAISDYSKALEINPRLAGVYATRGVAYYRKGQYDKAISDYSRALEINPRLAGAYSSRGIAYFLKREYDKAWDDVYEAQNLGYQVDPGFLKALRRASRRQR
jgi:tetratricopeptide (TPR) repeat protein